MCLREGKHPAGISWGDRGVSAAVLGFGHVSQPRRRKVCHVPPDNTCTAPPPLTVPPPFAEARVSQKQKIKTEARDRDSHKVIQKYTLFFLKERGSWWALPSDFMQLASITTLSHYLWIQTPIETLFVFPLIMLVEVFYTYTFTVCLWQHVWLPVIFAVSYTFARPTLLNQAWSSFPLPFHVFPFRD